MNEKGSFGIRIGNSSRISDEMEFEEPVQIQENCYIRKSSIGSFTFINNNVSINSATIGRYCSIGPGVIINPGRHPTDGLTTSSVLRQNPFSWFTGQTAMLDKDYDVYPRTRIGHDVWIGANAIVMPGVHIGNGSVIGAGSVVTKDVPEFMIALGVPARSTRSRFPIDVITRLLNIQWWRYDLSVWELTSNRPLTRPLAEHYLDLIERSIATHTAPLISGRRCRVFFTGTKANLERLEDET